MQVKLFQKKLHDNQVKHHRAAMLKGASHLLGSLMGGGSGFGGGGFGGNNGGFM